MKDMSRKTQLMQKMNVSHEGQPLKDYDYAQDQTMKDQVAPVPYRELFYFADRLDMVIMLIAIIFSLGNGVSVVFYSVPIKQLISAFSASTPIDQIVQATLKSVYGFLINSGILFINCWIMTAAWTITSQRQMNRARKQYFAALLNQQISWHDRNKPAVVCSKMYIQISKVQQGLVTNMTSVLNKISVGASGIIMALVVGYQMALVMIVFLPVMMLSGYIRAYFMKQKEMYMQTKKVKLDSDVIEVFDNIKTIKILNSQEHQSERYQKCLKKQKQILWSHGWKGSFAYTFFFFCIILNYALGFWYGTKLVSNRTINQNTGKIYQISDVVIVFFTLYISNLSLSGLPDSIASFNVCRYSMKKIIAIITRKSRIKDGYKIIQSNINQIQFKDISFHYEQPLFSNLNLSIKKGVTIIIGQSGCGKSTVISLLMRFYDPIRGTIELKGISQTLNLCEIKNESLRQKIGYVGQQPVLIGKTIREVLMAENISDTQVYSILSLVKADKFVRQIGLYSQFKSVSGGQKQRLAIARAMLKRPQILILDQSTSALDPKTEQQVLKGISKFGINFVIMVAHRHETLVYADRIIKIKRDEIEFQGTYNQLIQKSGNEIEHICDQDEENNQQQLVNEEEQMQKVMNEIKKQLDSQQAQKKKKEEQKKISGKFTNLQFQMGYFKKLMALNKDKWYLYVLGILGAVYFGSIFPIFSYLISRIIFILQKIILSTPETISIYQNQAHLLSIWLFIISFGSLIFTTMRWIIFQYFTQRIGYIVKSRAFKKLINLNYVQIQQNQPQTYSFMINKSCDDLKPLAGNFLPMIIENLVTLIVGLGIAFAYSWQVTLISFSVMPIILLSSKMMMSFNHGMQSNTDQIHKKNHELVITSIMHLRTIRSCHLEQRICSQYSKQLDDALKFSIKYGNLAGIMFGFGQTLISCTFAIIFLIGSYLIKYGYVEVTNLYTAILAIMFAGVQAGGNLYFLGQLAAAKMGACVYFKHISNKKTQDTFIQQLSDFESSSQGGGTIKIQNLTFNYQSRRQPIFNNFNLQIKSNEKVAIVGESGCGKSTLVNLLFRLYEADKGSIIINGQQISKLSKRKIARTLGIVMQQPALFNRSVYENLKYNTTKANFNQIKSACQSTNSYQFIVDGNFGLEHHNNQNQKVINVYENSQIPQGFNKIVGPRGSYLSGGQKQRLSIARALIRKPNIFVLDEATSALDAQNEKAIQQTIQNIKNVTQIIIAHRLSTIINCDRIVVLKNGKIIQEGTYQQLIRMGGYFCQLANNKKQIQQTQSSYASIIVDPNFRKE